MEKLNYAQENLKGLAEELDSELGSVNSIGITLNDIKTLLNQLRERMDNVKEGEIRHRFKEFHREVRVLDQLCTYTVGEFNEEYDKLHDINQAIFEKAVRQESENNG